MLHKTYLCILNVPNFLYHLQRLQNTAKGTSQISYSINFPYHLHDYAIPKQFEKHSVGCADIGERLCGLHIDMIERT